MKFASAIIVAAGVGTRMGNPIPKQFLEINGRSILEHTLKSFLEADMFNEIIIVHSEEYWDRIKSIIDQYPSENILGCIGGKERFHSVKNALNITNNKCEIVFIHDAVRPFCTANLLELCFEELKQNSNAIPAISLKDSIRKVDNEGISQIVDRSNLRSIQTPQVFDYSMLRKAYDVIFSESFTDDASVFEASGNTIHLVKGESTNIKITTPDDLEFARLWL